MFELPADVHAKVKSLHRYQRRVRTAIILGPPLFALTAWTLLWLITHGELFSIPQDAAKYMLDTLIWHFSPRFLVALVRSEHRSIVWAPVLLTIYYVYHLVSVAVLLTFPIAGLLYWRVRLRRHERGLLTSTALIDAMTLYLDQPSIRRRAALRLAARFFAPSTCASPVAAKWAEQPAFQWFASATLARPERDIILSLGSFKDSLIRSIAGRMPLDAYLESLSKLQEFFYLVCRRSSRHFALKQRGRASDHRLAEPEREVEVLRAFAVCARPHILAASREPRKKERSSSLRRILSEFIGSRALQAAGALSSAAAVMMTLGVLLFGIELRQAFLTWFTATFGSFAISLGISSVASRSRAGSEDSTSSKP